ncbi:unknown [[Mannheimia] succiniciproducens MBEL55E]|uniref:Uncharacterized protein n=1 Tax=Mannheimia succiniciproducens (strain KCTC 0769BP / MBEL55E) TaxID=221988 RepID=Q65TE8_MANSM|nr:unknown [[Mannheimia] succiniciproducens MBEL55E]
MSVRAYCMYYVSLYLSPKRLKTAYVVVVTVAAVKKVVINKSGLS